MQTKFLQIKVDKINLIIDRNIMANKFNSFFSNVGPVLANKIPKTHGDISDYMSGNFSKVWVSLILILMK